jgi:hypothetical protein
MQRLKNVRNKFRIQSIDGNLALNSRYSGAGLAQRNIISGSSSCAERIVKR